MLMAAVIAFTACVNFAHAGNKIDEDDRIFPAELVKSKPYVVWHGSEETMTAERFAAYCAPILWFSPDEPLLEDLVGKDILEPEPFPFEESRGKPVVYFRFRRIVKRGNEKGNVFDVSSGSKGDAAINLRVMAGADLDFFFYYPREEGLNAHEHDVESVQMKVAVVRGDTDDTKWWHEGHGDSDAGD